MSAYLVYPPQNAGTTGRASGAQSVALGSGVSSKAVTFTTAFGSTAYALVVSITNVTDATPIFLQAIITAKSSSGFTATFNAATDTANYLLEYVIVGNI